MSGIGRYIRNVLKKLFVYQEIQELTLVGNTIEINNFLKEINFNENHKKVKYLSFGSPIYNFSEQTYGSYFVNKNILNQDVIHFPHYSVPWLLPKNSVVTVHDLTHFRLPECHNSIKLKLAKLVLQNSVRKAGRIIAVSKSTAEDLQEMFPGIENKIHMIYQGVSENFHPLSENDISVCKRKTGLGKYLLYVGNRKPHKNLSRLLEAYMKIKSQFPDLQLVIVGKKFIDNDEVSRAISKAKARDIIEIENASNKVLLHLYCGAEALVFPSIYEGFGLPPLEAMACGTPVVVSNISSIPEVVNDAGIYFDPYDTEDMAKSIINILSDQNRRIFLREKGLERAKYFTWEKTAMQTFRVYKELVGKGC